MATRAVCPTVRPRTRVFGIRRSGERADTAEVKLRYAIGGIAAAALLALPAGAAASPGGQATSLTAQQCAQERADIGKKAFHKRYGAADFIDEYGADVTDSVDNSMAECIAEDADQILNSEDYGDDDGDDGSDG